MHEDRDDGEARFVAFAGTSRSGLGDLAQVAVAARRAQDHALAGPVLVFDRHTGGVVDLDLRGSDAEIAARLAAAHAEPIRRGRPKLGVIAREVTLLPRHWDWLAHQPGGASTTLRRLVETARKADMGANGDRERSDAAYRFMFAMAGDLPGFEEAARALFAGDRAALESHMSAWPPDIRAETLRFADPARA